MIAIVWFVWLGWYNSYPAHCLFPVTAGSVSKNPEIILFKIIYNLSFLVLIYIDYWNVYKVCMKSSPSPISETYPNFGKCDKSISRGRLLIKFLTWRLLWADLDKMKNFLQMQNLNVKIFCRKKMKKSKISFRISTSMKHVPIHQWLFLQL